MLALAVDAARGLAARPPEITVGGATYRFVAGAGMYRRQSGAGPRWVAPEACQERLYDARGWGVIGREGADATDETAFDFVGDGAAYAPAFSESVAASDPLVVSSLGYDVSPRPPAADGLRAAARAVLLEGATEPPRSYVLADGAPFLADDDRAVYCCAASGLPVFAAADAFPSTSGWPAFRAPIDAAHVRYRRDGSAREVLCAATGAHLGHAIDEGARARYCVNAAALFAAAGAGDARVARPVAAATAPVPRAVAALAAAPARARLAMGCFWGAQRLFDQVPGVLRATAGVSRGVEVVDVAFDPAVVAYADLLELFFASHDPRPAAAAGPRGQGGRYRCEVHALDDAQAAAAEVVRAAVAKRAGACATAVVAAARFDAAPPADQHLYRRRRGLAASEKRPLAALAALPNKLED